MISTPPPTYQPRQHSERFLSEDPTLSSYIPSITSSLFANYHADNKDNNATTTFNQPPRTRRASVTLEEARPAPASRTIQRGRLYRADRAMGPAGPRQPRPSCNHIAVLMILLAGTVGFCYLVKFIAESKGLKNGGSS